jgi:hypothetical protein
MTIQYTHNNETKKISSNAAANILYNHFEKHINFFDILFSLNSLKKGNELKYEELSFVGTGEIWHKPVL